MRVFLPFLALLALLAAAPARADEAKRPCPDAFARIARGEPALLVVLPHGGGRTRASEAYADWAHYLDAFVKTQPALCVASLTPAAYRAHVAAPRLKGSFATVFVRGEAALAHDGMALGPESYEAGRRFLSDGTAASAETAGMKAAPFRLRPPSR